MTRLLVGIAGAIATGALVFFGAWEIAGWVHDGNLARYERACVLAGGEVRQVGPNFWLCLSSDGRVIPAP